MINRERFWEFAYSAYTRDNNAAACLYWQDNFSLNVNLLLLAALLEQEKLVLAPLDGLVYSITDWQKRFLLPIRDFRQQCKSVNQQVYEKAKHLELMAEKVEQKLLLEFQLNSLEKRESKGDYADNIQRVFNYYQVPASQQQRGFITSLKKPL